MFCKRCFTCPAFRAGAFIHVNNSLLAITSLHDRFCEAGELCCLGVIEQHDLGAISKVAWAKAGAEAYLIVLMGVEQIECRTAFCFKCQSVVGHPCRRYRENGNRDSAHAFFLSAQRKYVQCWGHRQANPTSWLEVKSQLARRAAEVVGHVLASTETEAGVATDVNSLGA